MVMHIYLGNVIQVHSIVDGGNLVILALWTHGWLDIHKYLSISLLSVVYSIQFELPRILSGYAI